jgi:hypothetical protein
MIIGITITFSIVIIFLLVLLGSEIRVRKDQLKQFHDYLLMSKQTPEILEKQEKILVARWVCCNCDQSFTLNFYRNMYNLSKNRLDISGGFRSYDCSKCGNNLMQIQFVEIPKKI